MGQLLHISKHLEKRRSANTELHDFVSLTRAKLDHPCRSHLTERQKHLLLQEAISEFQQLQNQGHDHGNH